MKYFIYLFLLFSLSFCSEKNTEIPEFYSHVDQTIWVVDDIENVMKHWRILGFDQIMYLDTVEVNLVGSKNKERVILALANLGGADITWIQPLDGKSVFSRFHDSYGDGALALVHRVVDPKDLKAELSRLRRTGMQVLEEIKITTGKGNLHYFIMDSYDQGKYFLGFVTGNERLDLSKELTAANLHGMRINQYAFAILDPEPVSEYWSRIGLPEFQLNHPELGKPHYYGRPADHDLMQGWQRHGSVAYEWCIPLRNPTVYDDHIKKHGEGIHHLAFSVKDMDVVLEDYVSKGYVVSMGGTWGEEGKRGSGRYEYLDLEHAGGLTMELLWNFSE
jgi:methylmalonyl-CoA/ethylmalonyl-CoA epimerase